MNAIHYPIKQKALTMSVIGDVREALGCHADLPDQDQNIVNLNKTQILTIYLKHNKFELKPEEIQKIFSTYVNSGKKGMLNYVEDELLIIGFDQEIEQICKLSF